MISYHLSMKFEMNIKCIMVGNSGVGKSSILSSYLNKPFELNTVSTIGVDFGSKNINIKQNGDEYFIKLYVWDTAGDIRYKTIVETYYKDCAYFILVFDITDKSTYINVKNSFHSLLAKYPSSKFILVANKIDINKIHHSISEKTIKQFCKENNISYMMTSAKNNENIYILFSLIYADAVKSFSRLSKEQKLKCKKFRNITIKKYDQGSFKIPVKEEVTSCACKNCVIF